MGEKMTITTEEAKHVIVTYDRARNIRGRFNLGYAQKQITRIVRSINLFGMGRDIISEATHNLSNLPGDYTTLCNLYDENPWLADQENLPARQSLDDSLRAIRQEVRKHYGDSPRFRDRVSRALLGNSKLRELLLED
jgi:hypothetical protein